MKRILLLILLSPICIYSQNAINFNYDFCIFRNDDSRIIVELYYSFDQSKLNFIKANGGYEAAGILKLTLKNETDSIILEDRVFKVPVNITDTANYNKNKQLLGQITLLLDSGTYSLQIRASDYSNPMDSISYLENFSVQRFSDNRVISSSLQLASNITKSADTKSLFYKNTLEVEPNPTRIYGMNFPRVYYYVELYNLRKDLIGDSYTTEINLRDGNNQIIKTLTKVYSLKNDSKVDFGHFKTDSLPTGKYQIDYRSFDNSQKKLVDVQKSFYVYNTDTTLKLITMPTGDEYLSSEYVKYTNDELEQEFNYIQYLLSETSISNFNKLNNAEQKKKFLYDFWKLLDPTQSTSVNEFKKDYMERIKYANNNFRESFFEGWKTDRGRVLCLYGKPDEIERHHFEMNKRAHEIWKYNALDGGVIFVFVDVSGESGNYTLVHSTKKNELSDYDWMNRIDIK